MKKVKIQQKDNDTRFGLMHIFGYKHSSANKMYGFMLQCVRSCYEAKTDRLCLQVNHLMQLKNELSMEHLRDNQKLYQAVKLCIHLYFKDKPSGDVLEEAEFERLNDIMKLTVRMSAVKLESGYISEEEEGEVEINDNKRKMMTAE